MDSHIRNYDYQSIDKSVLAPYYKKICRGIIDYIPSYVSPNIITLIGLATSIASTLLIYYLQGTLDHSTLCLMCFACLFAYQLIDILDGMQAGKVGMYYNPTTELFDHGCDSVTTVCISYNVLALSGAYNREYVLSTIFMLCVMINFYLSTWQHSNTKIMEFRAGLLNPTETIFAIKCTFLILAIWPNILYDKEFYVVVFILTLTMVHFIMAVQDTFSISTNSDVILVTSLFPIFMSGYQMYYFIKFGTNYDIFNIIAPLVLGIIELLWLEISGEYMNGKSIYLYIYIMLSNLLLPNTWTVKWASLILIFSKFNSYVETMCTVLGMESFYNIPMNRRSD